MVALQLAAASSLLLTAVSARRLLGSSFGSSAQSIFRPAPNATYDYVVVGGGTGGIPMAVRLAEAGYSVAIVEAGSFYEQGNSNFSQIPMFAPMFASSALTTMTNLQVDWGFNTTPQAGQQNQIHRFPRGKTLGGSSARNFMCYHYATNGSFQQWADAVGDQSYTMEQFYPYLHKPLNFTPPPSSRAPNSTATFARDLLHDTEGPVSVSFPAFNWGFTSWAQKALAQAGLAPRSDGFTTGALNGSSYVMLSVDPSVYERESSQTSYLSKLGLANENLIVYDQAMATRILFDGNKTATGVAVDFGGIPITLFAKHEVILSAGVFQSPQLLMVSGVGPAAVLKSHNITVIADRPGVGQNLQDHVIGGISRRVNTFTTGSIAGSLALQDEAVKQYLSEPPRGPMTSFSTDMFGFEKLPQKFRTKLSNTTLAGLSTFASDWPELEILINNAYGGPQPGFLGSPDGLDWAAITVALLTPFSRGNVSIKSADTHDHPVINPNWLTDPRDQDIAVQAWRRIQDIFNQTSLQGVLVGNATFPPAEEVQTDQQILTYIQGNFRSILHPACTCKMGMANDSLAVVDPQARVYGVKNLRIVDASAFPFLPPGHPQSTICKYIEFP